MKNYSIFLAVVFLLTSCIEGKRSKMESIEKSTVVESDHTEKQH